MRTDLDILESENKRLKEALTSLVIHDRTANNRDNLQGCIELQRAEHLLETLGD